MFFQSAKFSDRTIHRAKNGKYHYAWLFTAPHCEARNGFSSRRDLAEKAAAAAASKIRSKMDRLEKYSKALQKRSNYQNDWAERKMRRVAEIRSGMRIEVVEIVEPISIEDIDNIIINGGIS